MDLDVQQAYQCLETPEDEQGPCLLAGQAG